MAVEWTKKSECAFDLHNVVCVTLSRNEQLELLMFIQNTIQRTGVVISHKAIREIPEAADYIDAQLNVRCVTEKLNSHRAMFITTARVPYFQQQGVFADIKVETVISIYDRMVDVLLDELIKLRSNFKHTADDFVAKERLLVEELEHAKADEAQKKTAYELLPADSLRDALVTWYGGVGTKCSSCQKIIIFDNFPQLFCCC